jgi:hypothetical protein
MAPVSRPRTGRGPWCRGGRGARPGCVAAPRQDAAPRQQATGRDRFRSAYAAGRHERTWFAGPRHGRRQTVRARSLVAARRQASASRGSAEVRRPATARGWAARGPEARAAARGPAEVRRPATAPGTATARGSAAARPRGTRSNRGKKDHRARRTTSTPTGSPAVRSGCKVEVTLRSPRAMQPPACGRRPSRSRPSRGDTNGPIHPGLHRCHRDRAVHRRAVRGRDRLALTRSGRFRGGARRGLS